MTAELHQTRMATAAEPPFHEEVEAVWGRAVGRVGRGRPAAQRARPPARAGARPDPRRRVGRGPGRARRSGRRLVLDAARAARRRPRGASNTPGSSRRSRPRASTWWPPPRSATASRRRSYVRDPLITVPGGAVIGRMAVRMRRGEEADITRVVAAAGLPILATMTGTATMEGGSFAKLRPGLAALGTSIRCNPEGARRLRAVLAELGWELIDVPLPGFTIHIDGQLTMVDQDLALNDSGRACRTSSSSASAPGDRDGPRRPGRGVGDQPAGAGAAARADVGRQPAHRRAAAPPRGVEVADHPVRRAAEQRRRRALLHDGARARAGRLTREDRQQRAELDLGLVQLFGRVGVAHHADAGEQPRLGPAQQRAAQRDAELAVVVRVRPADRPGVPAAVQALEARGSAASRRACGSPPTAGVGCSSPARSTAPRGDA